MSETTRKTILIVVAQFLCTSVWFAGNIVMAGLDREEMSDQVASLGHLTAAVQLGFITGTLVYAFLAIADRFSPSRVFFFSALAAAFANAGIVAWPVEQDFTAILIFRFLTGFFLAGIYPVGMKIAADYYEMGLGKALAFLVGALVLGTAFPHLFKTFTETLPLNFILLLSSGFALAGALLIFFFVPDGPYRKKARALDLSATFSIFKNKEFKAASFGYFGHMWELYCFWAFVPLIISHYHLHKAVLSISVSMLSFIVIGAGALACVAGGYMAQHWGSKRTAFLFLCLSCVCCLLSPLAFLLPPPLFMAFLIFWGLVVIADSPLFSALVAQHAVLHLKGTALTMVTCIGFAITIASIELTSWIMENFHLPYIFVFLAIGPFFGLWALYRSGLADRKKSSAKPEFF